MIDDYVPSIPNFPDFPIAALIRRIQGSTVDVRVLLSVAQGSGQSAWTSLVPLAVMLGIFYFLLIAPMRKRQKQQEQMIAELKTGDRVLTAGGVYGTIVGIKDDRLTLRIADQVKIEITKSSVSGLDASAST